MGRKQILKPFKMLNAADMSSTQTSASTNVEQLDLASIIVEWTGSTPVGVISVEGQNGASGWQALDFGASIDVSGNTGSHVLIFNELPFQNIRIKYTKTSGTGNITATLHAKDLGA